MKSRRPGRSIGLYRSRHGVFLGVCQGLGERLDLSPWGIRLLLIALQLTIAHWIFLAYILLALLLKPDPVERFEKRYERYNRY